MEVWVTGTTVVEEEETMVLYVTGQVVVVIIWYFELVNGLCKCQNQLAWLFEDELD